MADVSLTRYFVLIYEVVDGYAARRAPHRDDHLALAAESRRRGDFVMGGAVGDPPERVFIVFRNGPAAEEFAGRDPYVAAGLVHRWEVHPWAVVAGEALDALADLQS